MFLAGSSGPSFSTKAPSSSAKPQTQPWQSGRPTSAQNKPWMPGSGSGSTPKASAASQPAGTQPTKPNYNLNFSSVIGGREERGVRGPGFGKRHWVEGKVFVTRVRDLFYVCFPTIITQIWLSSVYRNEKMLLVIRSGIHQLLKMSCKLVLGIVVIVDQAFSKTLSFDAAVLSCSYSTWHNFIQCLRGFVFLQSSP